MKPFERQGVTRDRLMGGVSFLRTIGRLKPGISVEQAQAAMTGLQQGYKAQHPGTADNTAATALVPLLQDVNAETCAPRSLTLLAAVAAVLLIACSNVANLLLVRFSGRRREISLRMALGATRGGIVRLFVIESTIVSVIAGALGLCLALWQVSVVPKLAGQNLPIDAGVSLHRGVMVFTLALSLLTGLAMGLYPAWQSSKADLVDGLKEGGRAISGSAGPAAPPPRAGRRASRAFGRAARGGGDVDLELLASEPAGSWFPDRTALAGRRRLASGAVS